MKRNKKTIFQKVYLRAFIDALIEIYEKGADYIDIVGIVGDVQDEITMEVLPEYTRKNNVLSGEDINDLLDGEE